MDTPDRLNPEENNVIDLDVRAEALGGVEYRLMKPGEGAAAHKFMAAQNAGRAKLSFPTVLALENKKIVGLFATHPRKDMVLAGPLVVDRERPRYRLVLRLIDSYDNLMRSAGIKSYVWYTEAGGKLHEFYERVYGEGPYAIRDGKAFFVKRL